MNTFALHMQPGIQLDAPVVRMHIDGRDLIDLARAVEQPFADADGTPSIAGGYDGLVPTDWLALPTEPGTHHNVYVLSCSCGDVGCWPLAATVTITDATITWSDFRQPYRPAWALDALGPFVFERAAYLDAARQLAASTA